MCSEVTTDEQASQALLSTAVEKALASSTRAGELYTRWRAFKAPPYDGDKYDKLIVDGLQNLLDAKIETALFEMLPGKTTRWRWLRA